MSISVIVFIVFLFLIIWFVAAYNILISKRNRVKEAWSDIEVQLKRRYNLIPNLVNAVKGYMKHEKGVFEEVTKARAAVLGARTPKERTQTENILSEALKNLFAVAEAYPQLRASENFQKLHEELTDTEDKIQAARRFYNSVVMDLNTAVEQFPTNLIAKLFHFNKEGFFELKEVQAKKTPRIQF